MQQDTVETHNCARRRLDHSTALSAVRRHGARLSQFKGIDEKHVPDHRTGQAGAFVYTRRMPARAPGTAPAKRSRQHCSSSRVAASIALFTPRADTAQFFFSFFEKKEGTRRSRIGRRLLLPLGSSYYVPQFQQPLT